MKGICGGSVISGLCARAGIVCSSGLFVKRSIRIRGSGLYYITFAATCNI